jgi:hypothetical protein
MDRQRRILTGSYEKLRVNEKRAFRMERAVNPSDGAFKILALLFHHFFP